MKLIKRMAFIWPKMFLSGKRFTRSSVVVSALMCFWQQGLSQITYTFTTAGATGTAGPNQTQVNTAYSATNLNGLVTSNSGIQSWTVPSGVASIRIETYGAQGGPNSSSFAGGLGARMRGDFTVTPGQVLKIL